MLDHRPFLSLLCRQMNQDVTFEAAAAMDHRLRRLSAILWMVGIIICLLVINSPLGRGYHRFPINILIICALTSLVAVWFVPWHRYNRDLFIVTTSSALILVPLLISWSGGWDSPFSAYYYFIIVFSALFYRHKLAMLVACATMAARFSPLLFGFVPPAGVSSLLRILLIDCTTYLSIVYVARAMADEIVRLYGETVQRLLEREQVRQELAERQRAEAALRESAESFDSLFRATNEGMAIHEQGTIVAANETFAAMLGYDLGDVLGQHALAFAAPESRALILEHINNGDAAPYEAMGLRKDGFQIPVEISGTAISYKGRPARLTAFRDITERKWAEDQLRRHALYDELTGLANRTLFLECLQQVVERAKRQTLPHFAVLFLDLDRFKTINDSLGHAAGDQLLVEVARRLEGTLRADETVARLGGDEFTILLDAIENVEIARSVADRIQQSLVAPFDLDGHTVCISASIGIALSTTAYQAPADVLRDADTALYRAKLLGKARHIVFDNAMHAHALHALHLEAELRQALAREEFVLHYQPIVALRSGEVTRVEALVRWQHPQRGMVAPGEFIPLAEETGLIVPLGRWVLQTACEQAKAWQAAGLRPITVAVNLSARQLRQPELAAMVAQILQETGLEPQLLELELTESSLMEDVKMASALLRELHALDVALVIDDFGTGYSSLSYLKRFPIAAVKIDRSFVHDITNDPNDAAIVTAIIAMAHRLNLRVISEGVEREDQLAFLRAYGCDEVQGFLFCRPLPAAALGSLLQTEDALAPEMARSTALSVWRPAVIGQPYRIVTQAFQENIRTRVIIP